MSVLVKGMDMPKNCMDCPLLIDGMTDDWCCLDEEYRNITDTRTRPEWCPLEEFHLIEFRGFTEVGPENIVVGVDRMTSANRFDNLLRQRVKKAAEKICDEIMENVKKEMQEEVKKAREIEDGR